MTRFALPLAILIAAVLFGFTACGTTYPRVGEEIVGQTFPNVRGTSLDGEEYQIPSAFAGAPVVLLIGYEHNTQFDLDRWILGMQMAGTKVRIHELPTIPGMIPGLFAGTIDSGMRSGIPKEDWPAVITIYGDGATIARFTGNATPLPGRIVLLDKVGKVAFFHDRGYSAGSLHKLEEVLRRLSGG